MIIDRANLAKTLTVLSVILIMTGGYLGLQWSESETPQQTLGSETLRIDYEAPAQTERGPWPQGHVFHRGSLGVPVDLAPLWNVTAEYSRTGAPTKDAQWSATTEIQSRGPGGQPWWSVEETPEDLQVSGDRASLRLDMAGLVKKANRLADEADVGGTLRIEVQIHHLATVQTGNGEAAAKRTARLVVDPGSDVWSVDAHDDRATYRAPAEKDPPVFASASAGLGLLLGVAALASRGRGSITLVKEFVTVRSLNIPLDAVEMDLQELNRVAQLRQVPVLHDPDQGVYLTMDQPPLLARSSQDPDRPGNGTPPSRPGNGTPRPDPGIGPPVPTRE